MLAGAWKQFDFPWTKCGSRYCQAPCRHITGSLDVSDLDRLWPPGQDLFAEKHLRGLTDRPVPALVPARQPNGSCHWFLGGYCGMGENAPYGCAFFDSHMTGSEPLQRHLRAKTEWDGRPLPFEVGTKSAIQEGEPTMAAFFGEVASGAGLEEVKHVVASAACRRPRSRARKPASRAIERGARNRCHELWQLAKAKRRRRLSPMHGNMTPGISPAPDRQPILVRPK
jgi:hypothetical protein